jgi:hypothetical protein
VPVVDGATGPVDSAGRLHGGTGAALATVDEVWQSLVAVLDELDAPSSALLCTADGFPIVGHGYCRADLVPAARLTGKMFAAHGPVTGHDPQAVESVALTSGPTQTVIASIPSAQGHHLLSITADGVSMPILQAWTTYAAVELRELLAAQP